MRLLIYLFLLSITSLTFAQDRIDTLSIDDFDIRTIVLPDILNEISALEYEPNVNNQISYWALNDSGNKSQLYRFSQDSGEVLQTIHITNAPNVDWEEISSDNERLYFADFGNNLGKRQDLAIYFIEKSSIDYSLRNQYLAAQKIEFYYPEQTVFNFKKLKTNWDAEAFFIYNNQIHLFTKEWANMATTHYVIPIDTSKKHAAKKLETFNTNYAVTGAYIDINPYSPTRGVYLLGYTLETLAAISWFELPDQSSSLFFDQYTKKVILPLGFTTQLGQLEAISTTQGLKNQVCFSGEEFNFKGFYAKQQLHCINGFTK